jgi:NAD(P)-dependent dehydrogenase (short-subunit alcohol dehydrogenase family)
MDLQLKGKRAVVTGGSRGIGLAIADTLAAEGVEVAIVARHQPALDTAREQILRHGHRVLAIPADTDDDISVRAMISRSVDEFGGVDILVNAAAEPAGPGLARPLDQLLDADLRRHIETKVLGYLRTARAAVPSMLQQGWGRIINISGLAALQTGSTFGSIRNVAVAAMTKNLADELGRSGINVTAVHPGMTVTERTPGLLAAQAMATGRTAAEVEEAIGAGTSIGRIITANEVADVVAFLASPRSVAITGDAIGVGGGAPGFIRY